MSEELPRPTAHTIYERAAQAGRDELERPLTQLLFSGLIGGLTMGLSGLGVAVVRAAAGEGPWSQLASYALYPAGFLAVILGRAQLFTENTLFPVLLVLRNHTHLHRTLRLWAVVLVSNLVGALLFALLVGFTGALRPEVREAFFTLGHEAAGRGFGTLVWTGVVGGWLIALVAWLVTASQGTSAQVVLIWFFTFIVGAGHFAHSIAGASEVMAAALQGRIGAGEAARWQLAAVLGNVLGGVGLVSLLNYGQVETAERQPGHPIKEPGH